MTDHITRVQYQVHVKTSGTWKYLKFEGVSLEEAQEQAAAYTKKGWPVRIYKETVTSELIHSTAEETKG